MSAGRARISRGSRSSPYHCATEPSSSPRSTSMLSGRSSCSERTVSTGAASGQPWVSDSKSGLAVAKQRASRKTQGVVCVRRWRVGGRGLCHVR
eukprot:2600650-Prymnesium_polylepis.1